MTKRNFLNSLCGLSLGVGLCVIGVGAGQSPYSSGAAQTTPTFSQRNGLVTDGPRPAINNRPQTTSVRNSQSASPATGVFPLSDQLHGIARPSQLADLPSLVAGTIQTVHVKEGQSVRKGDPLITLDDRVPKARLEAATVEAQLTGGLKRAEVDLKMAERRLSRLRSIMNQGAGAAFEIEEAEGVHEQAQAAVEEQKDVLKSAEATRKLAEAQLSEYTISAPFDGIITEIHQKSGAVDPSIVLVTVANLETLQVEMHLPSRMYGKVRPGQSLPLLAGTPIGGNLKGKVISSSPVINSASDTFRCVIDIMNPQTRLPAGFSVIVNAQQGNRPVASAAP